MNYWEECILDALEEAGVKATKEQIDMIVSAVEGAHETYDMAHGYDCIPNPANTELSNELNRLKQEKECNDKWVCSTKPCINCTTTGTVLDIYGRDMTCPACDGKGRVLKNW